MKYVRVLILFFLLPAVCTAYPTKKLSQLRKGHCNESVQALLDKWAPSQAWTAHGIAEDHSTVFRTPTQQPGVWIELHIFKSAKVELYRISRDTKTKVVWSSESCISRIVTSTVSYENELLQGTLSDEVLQNLLRNTRTGVIYAWSPHMPYSLIGIKSIRAAAKKLGLTLTLVLDPNADFQIAKSVANQLGLTGSDLKRIESIELLQRQMTMHFPSILVHSKGKILGPIFPGVKNEEIYARFIEDQIKRSR